MWERYFSTVSTKINTFPAKTNHKKKFFTRLLNTFESLESTFFCHCDIPFNLTLSDRIPAFITVIICLFEWHVEKSQTILKGRKILLLFRHFERDYLMQFQSGFGCTARLTNERKLLWPKDARYEMWAIFRSLNRKINELKGALVVLFFSLTSDGDATHPKVLFSSGLLNS